MHLSVSTAPSDSPLASLLHGADTPGDLPDAAGPGDRAAAFAALFPGLASATTTAAPATNTAAVTAGNSPAAAGALPPWVGSTQPLSSAPQSLATRCGRAASAAGESVDLPATDDTEAPGVAMTPGVPAAVRPAVRSLRRDPETTPRTAAQLAPATVPLLPLVTLPLPPVVDLVPGMTQAPAPDAAPPSVAADATADLPSVAAPRPGAASFSSSLSSPASRSPDQPVLPSPQGSSDGPNLLRPLAPWSLPSRTATAVTAAPSRLLPGATPAESAGQPVPAPPTGEGDAIQLGPDRLAEPDVAPGARPLVTHTFAPSEILSRQFASSARPATAPDSLATSATLSGSFSFASPVAPPSPTSAESALAALPGATVEDPVVASELAATFAPVASTDRREFASGARAGKSSATRGANIAARAGNFSAEKNTDLSGADKTFLSASGERVALHGTDVGTGVAKPEATMPAAFFNRSASAAVLDHAPVATGAVAPAERSADAAPSSLLAPEPVAAAQRAVEAVLTAAERFSSGERQSVNLHFSVGGADLNVRVELRADEVHATFRTDSPELRSALAHEWQAVNGPDGGDRSQRLASPVFTTNSPSSDAPSLSSFAGGDGSSRQRDTGARRANGESFEVAAARARGARSTAAVSPAAADSAATLSSSPRATSPAIPRRLQTHA